MPRNNKRKGFFVGNSRVFVDQQHHFFKQVSSDSNIPSALKMLKKAFSRVEGFESLSIFNLPPSSTEYSVDIEQIIVGRDSKKPSVLARTVIATDANIPPAARAIFISGNENARPEWLHAVAGMFSGDEASFIATRACNLYMLEIEKFIATAYQHRYLSDIKITPSITLLPNTKVASEIYYAVTAKMVDGRYIEIKFNFDPLGTKLISTRLHHAIGAALQALPVCKATQPKTVTREIFEVCSNLQDQFEEAKQQNCFVPTIA